MAGKTGQNTVRIIGGAWRRRVLSFPDQPGLRPTPDRVRETVFNWLGQTLDGLSVLDPTCGSGAFLFAALGILKPLYDATLRTLQAVRTDALIAGEKSSPEK